jgi:streptomycin 6-kinase
MALLNPADEQRMLLHRVRGNGDAAAAWIRNLPKIVAKAVERWSLTLEPHFPDLKYNFVAPARLPDGTKVVLKVCYIDPEGDFYHEEAASRAFGGQATARLLESDLELGALLIERLSPGTVLARLEDDDAATHVAAGLMQRLWRRPPAGHPFPAAAQWIAEACSPAAIPGRKRQLPWAQRTLEQAAEMAAETGSALLLHGDLHQYNILAAEREPWLAIDPHGVIGDPAWELAPLLVNCLQRWDRADWPRIILRRADQLVEELSLDARRAYAWNATRALQCAFWSLRDDGPTWDAAVVCAEVLSRGPR